MNNVSDNILIIAEFLDSCGINIDDFGAATTDKNGKLYIYKNSVIAGEETNQIVSVKLEEDKNSLIIKKQIIRHYDFKPLFGDPELLQDTYTVDDTQTLTKFKVIDGVLNKYTVTVFQRAKEDTTGGGKGFIYDIDSFSKLLDENINYSLGLGSLPVEKTSYSIPADYKITDGLSGVEVIESQVLLKNK